MVTFTLKNAVSLLVLFPLLSSYVSLLPPFFFLANRLFPFIFPRSGLLRVPSPYWPYKYLQIRPSLTLWKCNLPMTPHVRLSVGWSVCWLVVWLSVCHRRAESYASTLLSEHFFLLPPTEHINLYSSTK